MALTLEDGSGVGGANSYATVQDARDYATLRGLSLPTPDGDIEKLLVLACDFLESLESQYKGDKTNAIFALAWPRQNVFLYNSITAFDKNTIPAQLIHAQCQLAFDAQTVDLLPLGEGRQVIEERVEGVVDIKYSDTKGTSILPDLNKALAILKPLLQNSAGFGLTSLRI